MNPAGVHGSRRSHGGVAAPDRTGPDLQINSEYRRRAFG
ncbi:hypothetical protein ABIA70_002415 [Arthrobacter sp. 754]